MTPELKILVLAALLQVLQYAAFSVTANMQVGPKKAASPRDTPVTLTGTAGRLQRAMNNHLEGLILFTIATLAITLSAQSSGFTTACAWVYLGARVLYVPAYAFGWVPWRSVIWMVGFAATVAILLAALV